MRAAIAAILLLAMLVAVSTVRQLREGSRALAESDAAVVARDVPLAIARARSAAEAVAPGSPYPARAYERLDAIGRDAEGRGDEPVAVLAWAAMRAAALETDGIGVDTSRWRAVADSGIARVGARSWSGPQARASSEVRPTDDTLRDALARTDVPSTWTLLLLAAGSAAFFGGAARLLWAAGDVATLRRSYVAALAVVGGGVAYVLVCVRG